MPERGFLESIVWFTSLYFKYKVSFTLWGVGNRSNRMWKNISYLLVLLFLSQAGPHLCFPSPSFVIIIPLSLIIHLFTQNTRLVSKESYPAWPLPSLSSVVLTPSRVGSHILSEGTLKKEKRKKERSFFFKCSFNPSSSLYLLCLWVWWALVCI